jgi:endoglucanase
MTRALTAAVLARLIGVAAAALPSLAAAQATAPAPSCATRAEGVPAQRLALLARGFNLTGWLDADTPKRPDAAALGALRRRGFTHVRLPVRLEFLEARLSSVPRSEEGWQELDLALNDLLGRGFAVSLDMHPGEAFAKVVASDRERAAAILEDVWRKAARRYARLSPERVFFELLNEPGDKIAWLPLAARLISAVRAEAPDKTLVVGPPGTQRIEALEAMTPFADRNAVYAIHVYDPMAFTHQGLDWEGPDEPLAAFRGVPFPASLDHPAVQSLRATLLRDGRTKAARALEEQLRKPWDEARVGSILVRAGAWAAKHRAAVIVNEFGALSWVAPPRDRARWIATVRDAAERNCIGWAHWDYADGFGLARRVGDRQILDEAIVDALVGPPRKP